MKAMETMDRRTLTKAAVVLAAVLFVALNVLSTTALRPARVDLTEDKLFTLSDGTRHVLASIDEPIVLRFYFSRPLAERSPVHGNYGARVRELLEHYVSLAGDKLHLEFYDPEPFSIEEDAAVSFGLQGVPLNRSGDLAYFGLAATNSTDDRETIPFFEPDREPYLEYDLTRLIFDLANPKKKVVGVIGSLPMRMDRAMQFRSWAIMEQMDQFFEVRQLSPSSGKIDDDVDVLMVAHPWQLLEATLYAIDQFVLAGGRAMVFVDPYSETMATRRVGAQLGGTSSEMKKLFDAWGVEFTKDKFVGDIGTAVKVSAPSGGRTVYADYVSWLGLGPSNLNREDVVTDRIRRVIMASAGFVAPKEGATTTLTPLMTTTSQAMRYDTELLQGTPDPVKLLHAFKSENRSFTLAARVHGPVKTAFPDGRPATGTEKEGEKPAQAKHLSESKGPINVVVVADTDLLFDSFWMQVRDLFGQRIIIPTANNADFVINVLDNLAGSDALIGLRSRGQSFRPFHRIDALQSAAELRYRKTEQGLMEKMRDTEKKLGELQTGGEGEGTIILTEKQKTTVEEFRAELLGIRKQLRDVQHALRKDIDALDTWLKVVNIWAVPGLISVIALVLVFVRRRRYRTQALPE